MKDKSGLKMMKILVVPKERGKLKTAFICITFFIFFSLSSFVRANENTNCLRCHPKIKARLSMGKVHPPLKQKGCTICHNIHTSDQPHLLRRPVKGLCLSCHKKFSTKYSHFPVVQGECEKCHDPHASIYVALLRSPENKICFSCHKKEEIVTGKYLHPPIKKGCLSCHKAHGGSYQWLLNRDLKEICFGCHVKRKVSTSHNALYMEGGICLSCHNVHASASVHLLHRISHRPYAKRQCGECHILEGKKIKGIKERDRSLCLKCHPMEKEDTSIYSHIHAGLNENVCLDCHSPHLSDEKPNLKATLRWLCFNCHRDARKRILSKSKAYKYKHPEVLKGNCLDCHSAHASNYLYLFKGGVVAVCTSCHKRHAKFTHPLGKKAIDPRCRVEMDCVSCHNPMGAKDIYHIIFDHRKELCIQCHKIKT